MSKRWNYVGDINLEHGGYFWQEDGAEDYVNAVRVTPCSDASGPNNLFWIENGSIYLPTDPEKRKRALDCCGYNDPPREGAKPLTRLQKRWQLVDAFMAYQGIEPDTYNGSDVVQIGAKREEARDCETVQPTVILRGNADLRRYIRKTYLSR